MRRSLKFLVVTGMLLIMGNAWAKETELKQIVFQGGQNYDGKDLPSSVDPILKAIKEVDSKATFGFSEGSLLVGLPGVTGKLSVKHDSDCPVNSQFSLADAIAANQKELVKPTLIAWTRIRHPGFEKAELDRYNETENSAEVVLKAPKAGNIIQR